MPPDRLAETEETRVVTTGPSGTTPFDPQSEPGLRRGQQVGRYLVVDELGVGGMGEVFSAYDPELDRRIALKLVKLDPRQGSTQGRARLLREAQALAKLSHPNVVAVHDAGTHGERIFIAMEYVEGRTLRSWLKEAEEKEDADQTWPRALELMLQAGRGLAAAHAEGLVHRDFKPANVMVSDDGRVRVLDFGLARRFDEQDEDEGQASPEPPDELRISTSGSRTSLEIRLTQTGTVMGTPAYMAPEQFHGGTIDARTDQFSVCVVLWRALFRTRPFLGEEFRDLSRAVSKGELQEMPKSPRVPRHVQAALRRGLSVARSERFPTMDALLTALSPPRRSRQWLGLGGLALGLAGAATVMAVGGERAPAPCQGAEDKLTGIWDDERRKTMREAFENTEQAYADDARLEVEQALDEHTSRWVGLHTEICEATRVRADQSEALMDLRIGCLDDRLRDVAALTEVFTERVDAEVVKNAALGVRQLPHLDECATLDRSDAERLQPGDPALAGAVAEARESIARARALGMAGKLVEAVEMAQEGLDRARATGFLPVQAEAFAVHGILHDRRAEPTVARESYEQALYAALETGHDRMLARALLGMASIVGNHTGETDLAMHYARQLEAVMQRLGNPPELVGSPDMYRGNAQMSAKHLDEAAEYYRSAAEQTEGIDAASRTHLAVLSNLAAIRGQQGHYQEAVTAFQGALATATEKLGPWHPFVASTHSNLGAVQSRLERYDEALEHLETSIAVYERSVGGDSPEIARAYHNRGTIHGALGDQQQALADYRHALVIKTKTLGAAHPSTASSANNVGDALMKLGRAEEAIPYLEQAIEAWTETLGADSPANLIGLVTLAEAYLALHRPRDAIEPARKALAVGEAGRVDPIEIAMAQFTAAQVLWEAGDDRDEARSLAHAAIEKYRTSERPSPKEIEKIQRWLAERP